MSKSTITETEPKNIFIAREHDSKGYPLIVFGDFFHSLFRYKEPINDMQLWKRMQTLRCIDSKNTSIRYGVTKNGETRIVMIPNDIYRAAALFSKTTGEVSSLRVEKFIETFKNTHLIGAFACPFCDSKWDSPVQLAPHIRKCKKKPAVMNTFAASATAPRLPPGRQPAMLTLPKKTDLYTEMEDEDESFVQKDDDEDYSTEEENPAKKANEVVNEPRSKRTRFVTFKCAEAAGQPEKKKARVETEVKSVLKPPSPPKVVVAEVGKTEIQRETKEIAPPAPTPENATFVVRKQLSAETMAEFELSKNEIYLLELRKQRHVIAIEAARKAAEMGGEEEFVCRLLRAARFETSGLQKVKPIATVAAPVATAPKVQNATPAVGPKPTQATNVAPAPKSTPATNESAQKATPTPVAEPVPVKPAEPTPVILNGDAGKTNHGFTFSNDCNLYRDVSPVRQLVGIDQFGKTNWAV